MSRYEIVERDEAGRVTRTYIASGEGRVDVITPKQMKSYAQRVLDVFLPAGYPQSVTDDYIQYQIYDSLQAFSSSIAGMLSSRAVLQGVGVGDASASPTAALLLSVLQESMGRIATILFAHRLGTALEPECKMYRLAADVFNDTAMVLDCLSPAFPKPFRVLVLSFSSVLRSLCGVCAGSAKASLSAHFAKKGNLGELNAKDSSQETVISLLGMLAGSIVVSWVSTPVTTWTVLIALLSIHLATNYAAVRAVSMRCLNRQRANIVFSHLLQHGVVLTPADVSQRERIFEQDGVLRRADDSVAGYCKIGVPLDLLLNRMGRRHKRTGSLDVHAVQLSELVDIFESEAYMLWFTDADYEALIVLKEGCAPIDQFKAWAHALLLASKVRGSGGKPEDDDASPMVMRLAEMRRTLRDTRALFAKYTEELKQRGWDLETTALETRAGVRAQFNAQKQN
ncbi:vitamin B6 photo-protection and homoeostasis-domain-containing protein [Paraphoma chrysanthemicola]|uniref:Vitamin B6 photo-protection and homoeostasis-domain-containing protein n=1 Tax=Paraphoma chrysanthemicola TaxID=798071 RepID=A0A8K0W4B4_9PLEO|nr:vitamin B6 photo-protection and homoeostasis-domain-containing protein [Paraphoma chrysanthemicola]